MSSDEEDVDLNEDATTQVDNASEDGTDMMDTDGECSRLFSVKSPFLFFILTTGGNAFSRAYADDRYTTAKHCG